MTLEAWKLFSDIWDQLNEFAEVFHETLILFKYSESFEKVLDNNYSAWLRNKRIERNVVLAVSACKKWVRWKEDEIITRLKIEISVCIFSQVIRTNRKQCEESSYSIILFFLVLFVRFVSMDFLFYYDNVDQAPRNTQIICFWQWIRVWATPVLMEQPVPQPRTAANMLVLVLLATLEKTVQAVSITTCTLSCTVNCIS
jgi:hypothetical protein